MLMCLSQASLHIDPGLHYDTKLCKETDLFAVWHTEGSADVTDFVCAVNLLHIYGVTSPPALPK